MSQSLRCSLGNNSPKIAASILLFESNRMMRVMALSLERAITANEGLTSMATVLPWQRISFVCSRPRTSVDWVSNNAALGSHTDSLLFTLI